MLNNRKKLCEIFSVIVVVLLVACAVIVYFPHGHECIELDCALCNMIDLSRDILFAIALLSIAQIFPSILFIFLFARERIALFSEKTPVGLKVKLSN